MSKELSRCLQSSNFLLMPSKTKMRYKLIRFQQCLSRFLPKRIIIFLFCAACCVPFMRYVNRRSSLPSAPVKAKSALTRNKPSTWPYSTRYCEPPHLTPIPQNFRSIYKPKAPISCGKEEDWVMVKGGLLLFRHNLKADHPGFECRAAELHRTDDFSVSVEDLDGVLHNAQRMTTQSMFVDCKDNAGKTFKRLLATMLVNGTKVDDCRRVLKQQNPGVPRETNVARPADVVMLGFDSMSRQAFKRFMPKSYAYFMERLGGVPVRGINVVGEGTPSALFAALTGHYEYEHHRLSKTDKKATHNDDLPWIWKEYSKAGYLTAWTEEEAKKWGTFQFRMLGFKDPPTDFYGRPHQLALELDNYRNRFQNGPLCFGSRTKLQAGFLDLLDELYRVHSDIPKFSLVFESYFTHDDNNWASMSLDDDTLKFLEDFHANGKFDNTIFILFSDHGARFGDFRFMEGGALEERQPLIAFRFPSWFEKKYPSFVANYRENAMSGVLVSHFDFHATLHHLLHLDKDSFEIPHRDRFMSGKRGYSFLQPIPKNRTCGNAGVRPFWCACIPYKPLAIESDEALLIGEKFVSEVNQKILKNRHECIPWKLEGVNDVAVADYPEDLSWFKPSVDSTAVPDRPGTKDSIYLVRVTLRPANAAFEFLVQLVSGVYFVDLDNTNRITAYGDQPKCILKTFPSLRPWCFCRNQYGVFG